MAYRSALPRRVYILGDGLLFDDIIAHMLTSANLRVIKRVYAGENDLVTDIEGCRPDVILLTETDRYNSEQILALLSRMPRSTDLRIMIMSMQHKNIRILDRPAGRRNSRAGATHTIQGIDDWSDVFDLVTGKRLQGGDPRI